jgi:hypothetical protein
MNLSGRRMSAALFAATLIAVITSAAQLPRASLALLAGAIAPAHADDIAASKWQAYTNTRYGVLIDYPADLFAMAPPPPDNAGRNFDAPAVKARFHIYSHANALDLAREALEAEDVLDLGDATAKKQNATDWYQIVARKGDETILRRVLLSEGGAMVHRLEIAFPTRDTIAFAPIVERMTKSFRLVPTIPEKAANDASAVPPPAGEWQRIDSIVLGLRISDYLGKAGITAELPASWIRSEMPEPNVISFTGAAGENELYVVFRADPHGAKATLASEAKAIKDRIENGADNYRLLDERTTKIASRPAIVFSVQYSGSDSPALLREDIAVIDAGKVFYFVHVGAPHARYAAAGPVFRHILKTIGFAD